jgi:hypothetical protein
MRNIRNTVKKHRILLSRAHRFPWTLTAKNPSTSLLSLRKRIYFKSTDVFTTQWALAESGSTSVTLWSLYVVCRALPRDVKLWPIKAVKIKQNILHLLSRSISFTDKPSLHIFHIVHCVKAVTLTYIRQRAMHILPEIASVFRGSDFENICSTAIPHQQQRLRSWKNKHRDWHEHGCMAYELTFIEVSLGVKTT